MSTGKFPNSYVIITALILMCAVITWLVPGSEPQTWQIFSALYDGFIKQAGIIVFILIVGGAFQILGSTGAVDYGIRRFISGTGKHDKSVLAAIALLFSAGGAIFGMSEEIIPFVGLVVPLVISMGYDAITGLLIVYAASNIGFSSAFLNPFTVGIAQQMSGLPPFSGMGYRVICWIFLTALTIVFTLIYASRIRKERSECGIKVDTADTGHGRHTAVLTILLCTVIALIIGATCLDWYMAEISALFLAMGILCGIAGGFGANRIADEFLAGARDILPAAMIVGLASGIIVILQNGNILDPMLNALASGASASSETGSLSLMYGVQALINLFIPSATAKAAITIPVMAPFSDMIGLSRQSMVLAFQFGDGFTNMITPTSGVLIASLAMAKVPYTKWVKLIWKPVLALIVLGFLLLLPTVFFTIKGF